MSERLAPTDLFLFKLQQLLATRQRFQIAIVQMALGLPPGSTRVSIMSSLQRYDARQLRLCDGREALLECIKAFVPFHTDSFHALDRVLLLGSRELVLDTPTAKHLVLRSRAYNRDLLSAERLPHESSSDHSNATVRHRQSLTPELE